MYITDIQVNDCRQSAIFYFFYSNLLEVDIFEGISLTEATNFTL